MTPDYKSIFKLSRNNALIVKLNNSHGPVIVDITDQACTVFKKKYDNLIDTDASLLFEPDLSLLTKKCRENQGEYCCTGRIISPENQKFHADVTLRISQVDTDITDTFLCEFYTKNKSGNEVENSDIVLSDDYYLTHLIDSIPDVICILDENFRILKMNKTGQELFNVSAESFPGMSCFEKMGETAPCTDCPATETLKSGQPEYSLRYYDQLHKWMDVRSYPVKDSNQKIVRIIEHFRDVSHHISAQNDLNSSLREKETLLREIHHRVKNNLSVIISLLSLQSDAITNYSEAREGFQKSIHRLRSMAIIHEALYQSSSMEEVGLKGFLDRLADEQLTSFGKHEAVVVNSRVGAVTLDLFKAIPIAMILNELLLNSLKHAFPGDATGKIEIKFTAAKGNYHLIFHDNGNPEKSENSKNCTGLGNQLIDAWVSQLEGSWNIDQSNGYTADISFPIFPEKK